MNFERVALLFFSLVWLIQCQHISSKVESSSNETYQGHGSGSLPVEVIERFAPKPLSAHEMDRIEKMLDVRSPSLGHLHPSGKMLFLNWSVTGSSQVWRVDHPKAFPVQMTGGQDATHLKGVTADGKWLILSRDRGGDEYPGLYLQSPQGGELMEIYRKDRVQAIFELSTPDGRWIYFRANDPNPSTFSIFKYDLSTQKTIKVFSEDGYWSVSDRLSSGILLLAKWTGSRSSEHYLFDERSQKLSPLFGQGESEEYHSKFGSSEESILVLTNKFSDFRRLYIFEKGEFRPITPDIAADVEEFDIDFSRTKILYSVNRQGHFEIGAMSLKGFHPLRLPNFKNPIHTYFGMTSLDGRFTTMGVETSRAPSINYIYDWKNQQLTQWTLPSAPEIDTTRFVEESLEFYEAEDGTKIPMVVARPSQCARQSCPVVVLFHGGPEGQSRPAFSPTIQLFVESGFVLVRPNVRGSDGYGKRWLDADNGTKRLEVLSDIRDCALWIKKNWSYGGVVPKMGVMGGSYGGYATLVAMTMYAGTYDAGSATVGMSNLITFLKNTAPYRRVLRESEYGFLEKDEEVLRKLSPISYLDRLNRPLQILHGANDPRVPAGEAVQIHDALAKRGVESELILFADEGHGVHKRANRALSQGHVLRFFRRHLL